MDSKARWPLVLTFGCFLVLGLGGSMLGVAWPSIRYTFGLSLGSLVSLLVSSTIGFVTGSLLISGVMARIGLGWVLIIANFLGAAGSLAYSLAPGWWFMVSLGLLAGWAGGSISTALSIYIAATRTVRTMNWMHACYGIGATIGPLVMTWILGANLSWRSGYALAASMHASLAICLFFVLDRFTFRGIKETSAPDLPAASAPSTAATLRMPVVMLSVLLFFLYTGVETTTGQWSYTLFVEERGITPYLAGVMTSLYWGMLTAGRILFGAMVERVGLDRLVRLSMMGALLAAVLFLSHSPWISVISVGLMGLSLSAIFPTLTSDTPRRVGLRHANHAIGLQTGAASVGVAALPSFTGILAERFSLEIIGPFLIGSASLLAVANEIVRALVRRQAREELTIRQSSAD